MPETFTLEERQTIAREVAQMVKDNYVFPEVGAKMAERILAELEQNHYDNLEDAHQFTRRLTADLQEISHDKHCVISYNPEKFVGFCETPPDNDLGHRLKTRFVNHGIEKVERLRGNIGYVDLRKFPMFDEGKDTLAAMLGFLANSDALIFDLRQAVGGDARTVQYIITHLLAQRQPLSGFYFRPQDTTFEAWTWDEVPGQRMTDVPVYVLTSHFTFSAAESFAYDLKHLGRATIVGETTGGGAHPVNEMVIHDVVRVRIAVGRAINPITNANWEGCGVEPDIPVAHDLALSTAHCHALERLIEQTQDQDYRRILQWELETVKATYSPVVVAPETLERYAGQYEGRTIIWRNGALFHTSDGQALWRLLPIAETLFALEGGYRFGEEGLKIKFITDQAGTASALALLYRDDGREVVLPRIA